MVDTLHRDYEPPLAEIGSELFPGQEPEIAPGVRGYAVESDGWVFIPIVIGNGTGAVGKFLDSVSPRCVFPTVISHKLRGMLTRRGFEEIRFGDEEVFVRITPRKP